MCPKPPNKSVKDEKSSFFTVNPTYLEWSGQHSFPSASFVASTAPMTTNIPASTVPSPPMTTMATFASPPTMMNVSELEDFVTSTKNVNTTRKTNQVCIFFYFEYDKENK